ncbi:MAG: hypothetical protein FJ224_12840 [Lentisphaerae bacterium]|nr:hypothetical protein [Lentisphaerota bacterium]
MYGTVHPAAKTAVSDWLRLAAPLMRSQGTLSIETNGNTALVGGMPYSTTNPVIQTLLARLYATRAGRLELLTGLRPEDAAALAEFLSRAGAGIVTDDEHSLETWVQKTRMKHVRVRRIRLKEIMEGDRVIRGSHDKTATQEGRQSRRSSGERQPRDDAKEQTVWADSFRRESETASSPPSIASEATNAISRYMRGSNDASPEEMAEAVSEAAHNPAQLAAILLKTALVRHELTGIPSDPVGAHVIACLRSAMEALLRAPGNAGEDGWADIARTLAAIEEHVASNLHELTGGTDHDIEAVHNAVREMQHKLEGWALKREYAARHRALVTVEQKLRHFFGIPAERPLDVNSD